MFSRHLCQSISSFTEVYTDSTICTSLIKGPRTEEQFELQPSTKEFELWIRLSIADLWRKSKGFY